MNTKIAVVAGTNTDTQMGCDLLIENGYEAIFLPISDDCNTQARLQYFSKDELYNLFYNTCKRAITLGAVKIFLYCNSLSSSVDYEKVAKDLNIEIITPLETYKNLPPYCKNIIILSANGVSSYTIDNIIHRYNKDVNTISIGNMSIVESIEEKKSPKQIIDELNLQGFIKYLENINHPKYKSDTLILGCTHFPYLKNEIKLLTKLNIIDANDDMIRRL